MSETREFMLAVHSRRGAPAGFAEVILDARDRALLGDLVSIIREDIMVCAEQFQLVPTIRRYCDYLNPRDDPLAALEIAHHVMSAIQTDHERSVASLGAAHASWAECLRRAAAARELLGSASVSKSAPNAVGTSNVNGEPRFAVEEILAKGSSGFVASGRDQLLSPDRADVAIKFYFANASKQPIDWLAESRRAAAISHPCGVRVIDCGETSKGQGYIVLERVMGEPLAAWLAMESALPVEAIALALADLAAAVHELHGTGHSHGDISLLNIMMDDSGRMRLVDYGLSRTITTDSCEADVMRLGEVLHSLLVGYVPTPIEKRLTPAIMLKDRLYELAWRTRTRPLTADVMAMELRAIVRRDRLARGILGVSIVCGVFIALVAFVPWGSS